MNAVSTSNENPVNIQNLLALNDKDSAETKKKARFQRNHYYQQKTSNLQNQIKEMKSSQKNKWKSALFGFFMDLFSTGLKALDFLVPGLGSAISGAVKSFKKLDPFKNQAKKAEVKASEFEQMAVNNDKHYQNYEKKVQEEVQHRARMIQRLERVVDDLQGSQEAMVRG